MSTTPEPIDFQVTNPAISHYACMRIDLGPALTLEQIQHLLYDLYVQRHAEPSYLFVSEQERLALTKEVRHMLATGSWPPSMLDRYGLEYGQISRLSSYATGSLIHIVALPELECGSVILGLFPVQEVGMRVSSSEYFLHPTG